MKQRVTGSSPVRPTKTKLFGFLRARSWKESGLPPRLEAILITSDEEAQKYKFFGSPAVQISGIDVDPRAAAVTKYGMSSCRPYLWQGKSYDFPPKEMILEALKK